MALNLRPGIDTRPPNYLLFVKLNFPFDDRESCIRVLKGLAEVEQDMLYSGRTLGNVRDADGAVVRKKDVVADWGLNLLVAFGLRFFLGPLEGRQPEEVIPNAPPGGVFEPRQPTRFDMTDRNVPIYLRTMNAVGDRDWVAKWTADAAGGAKPDDAEIDQAYAEWLSAAESDIILHLEANNKFLLVELWDQLRKRVTEPNGLELVGPIQEGFNRGDGRDHTGWFDGLSNLQNMIESDPQGYRRRIYLPTPATLYPGDPIWNRDEHWYDGGTYMIHRKYLEHLDRWNADEFSVTDAQGNKYEGELARSMAIGRDRETGKVISRMDGRLLEAEPDATEVNLAYDQSHILQSRGGEITPFVGPGAPLTKPDEMGIFKIQDIRMRRRGCNFAELDSDTGKVEYGLHFFAFQNNIQQGGFEFINNAWLFGPFFRRYSDPLFAIDGGVVEPVEGSYYFVPPMHRQYPGDVFFESRRY